MDVGYRILDVRDYRLDIKYVTEVKRVKYNFMILYVVLFYNGKHYIQ